MFSFLGKVAHGDQKPGGGVFGFLDQARKNPVQTYVNAQKVGGNLYQGLVQGIAKIPETTVRSTAELEARGANKIFGTSLPTDYTGTITDPFRQQLYGTNTLQTYQKRGQGIADKTPIPAPLAVFALAAADLTPGGKGKPILEGLTKASTVEDVLKIAPGLDRAKALAISKVKDPLAVKNILEGTHQVPSPAPIQDIRPTPDEILNREVASRAGEVIPPASTNPLEDIQAALNGTASAPGQSPVKGLRSVRTKQVQSLSKQRGARFEAQKSVTEPGSAGYFQERGALAGEYDKPKLGGLIENIGPGRAEELFANARQHVLSLPDEVYQKANLHPQAAKFNTQTALRKVIFGEGGGVPTTSELKLLDLASPELAADIRSKIPKSRRLMDFAAQLAGVPRALKATLDLSMGGRQGILVAARHPKIWAKANAESFKMFKNKDYYHQEMANLRARPSYDLAEQHGVRLPATEGAHEEAYASSDIAEKIPVAKHAVLASSRAYDGGLARMRMDLWDSLLNKYGGVDTAPQKLGDKGMQDLAEVVNTVTGRGGKKGGFTEKHMNSLSETLFSPRLWASRLNTLNPRYYQRLSPAARKEALESAGAFAVVAGAVLGGFAVAGAEVSTDPRSADFLKVKFGDKRYDILGGFQQNLVFAYRELTGEKVNSQTGEATKFARNPIEIITGKHPELADTPFSPDRLSVASDTVANKLNPLISSGLKIIKGKDKSGQDVNPAKEIASLFVPLNLSGAYELIQHQNGSLPARIAKGTAENIPNTFGVGSQAYGKQDLPVTGKPGDYLKKLESEGAPKEQVSATKNFFQTAKIVPNKTEAYKKIDEAIKAKDFDKAQQIAESYNSKIRTPFKKWNDQYGKYANQDLVKYYNGLKIPPDFLSSRMGVIRKEGGL